MMLFKRKAKDEIKVMHYEGINQFATDYPCTLKIKDNELIIKRIKPETIVTLPMDRIKSFTAMEEKRFMQEYKGNQTGTSKFGKKYYLVVDYDKGMLVFWGTGTEYGDFVKLQNYTLDENAPTEIEL